MNTDFCFIVPYRNRIAHLRQFVPHIQKRFKRCPIYIIEQADEKLFNRGKLLNIGFKFFGVNFSYAAYHDVDMLPTKSDYSYPHVPTHLATKVQQFNFQLPSVDYFGGVVLFNTADFMKCGGYSNHFWGWGGEDNELFNTLTAMDMRIERRSCYFESLYHPRAYAGPFDPVKLALSKVPRAKEDGCEFSTYSIADLNTNFYGCTKLSVVL